MTEKEAWLKIARMFTSGNLPLVIDARRTFRVDGICRGTLYLRKRGFIDRQREMEMDHHLEWRFRPPDTPGGYYWPRNQDHHGERATACCFLAAMCDG